ncbi:hypothetical protein ACTXT7_015041 [Hymenolepis weldensis]
MHASDEARTKRRAALLLATGKELKHPEEKWECLWSSPIKNTPTSMKKSIEEMIGEHVQKNLTEVPTLMNAHEVTTNSDSLGAVSSEGGTHRDPSIFSQGLRVNVDADTVADVYMETL